MKNITKTSVAASLLIIGLGLAVVGCGSKKATAECVNHMKRIGLDFRISEGDNNDLLEMKPIANQLRADGQNPSCPSGSPYFICDFGKGDAESHPEKILGYCEKHHVILMADGSVLECKAGDFADKIKTSLFADKNIASELSQLVGNVSPAQTETVTDPDPTGKWTSGDKNSVYSRLTVSSIGTFNFETVDFTGDVKGGYSGSWEMNGKSVRFVWDGGSCSGRRTASRTLVFGSTTFQK